MSEADRAALTAAWAVALRDTCTAENGWPTAPFPIVYESIVLERSAAIFRVSDPTGAVAAIRNCISRAADTHEIFSRDDICALHEASGFKIPGIVHSTFMRFGSPPLPTLTPAAIQDAFDTAAAAWRPVSVTVDRMLMVHEVVPYMQLDLGGTDAHCIVAEYDFA